MSTLFSPIKLGPYQLSHRVVMAPLTRMRSDPGDVPSDLMVEYYSQRASKGGGRAFSSVLQHSRPVRNTLFET
jgi:N-ethylmaleimide reductase